MNDIDIERESSSRGDGQEPNQLSTKPDSLGTVYAKFQPFLVQVVSGRIPTRLRSKLNPSDVIQETLMSLHKSGVTFEDKDEKRRRNLLLQALRFRISNLIRYFDQGGRLPTVPEQSFEAMIESGEFDDAFHATAKKPSDVLDLKESVDALRSALETLTPREREIVELRVFEFLEFSEIAERLQMKKDNACTTFHRTMKKLKVQLPAIDPQRWNEFDARA